MYRFISDANGRITMYKQVGKLRQAVADTQMNKRDTAYIHCHADQIDLGTYIYFYLTYMVSTLYQSSLRII